MRWFYTNKENFISKECINPNINKYILRLTPNTKFTSIQNENDEKKLIIRYIKKIVNNEPTVKEIKEFLLSLQTEYDNNIEVNSFNLNGEKVWLDKATRVGLFNLLNLEKTTDKETTTLWFNDKSITININKAIKLLTAVEMYAKQCYDVTQQHYAAINNFKTIEECLTFDITADYPEILNIQTT